MIPNLASKSGSNYQIATPLRSSQFLHPTSRLRGYGGPNGKAIERGVAWAVEQKLVFPDDK